MPPARTIPTTRTHRGFTLAESLVASVVLAIAVVGVSSAILASHTQTEVQEDDAIKVSLTRQLLEEIVSLPLTLPDASAGFPTVTNRSLYDTINDYSGYTDRVSVPVRRTTSLTSMGTFNTATPSATVVVPTDPTVALVQDQYSRTVSVTYPTSIYGTTVTSGTFAIVKVTTRGNDGSTVEFSRLVAKTPVQR